MHIDPPEATSSTFPTSPRFNFMGEFTCCSSVAMCNWLYSEFPHPNTSPLSEKNFLVRCVTERGFSNFRLFFESTLRFDFEKPLPSSRLAWQLGIF